MIYNLQILRALAAYMVFLHHFSVYLHPVASGVSRIDIGAAGVDIFFVISGFIMVATTSARPTTPAQFLANRVARLFPVYLLVTLAITALCLAGFKPIGVMAIRLSDVVQSILFLPFDRGGYVEPVNSVGWTLNYEMFFYVLFAALLTVRSDGIRVLVLFAALAVLALCSLIDVPNLYAEFYTRPIILDFGLGAILGYLHRHVAGFSSRTRERQAGYGLLAGGFAVLAASQLVGIGLGSSIELSPFLRLAFWGTGGFLIVAGTLMIERGGRVWSNRIVFEQGNASFSIYLIHNLILHAASKLAAHLAPAGWPSAGLIFVVAFGATASLGVLLYRFVELPLNTRLRAAFRPRTDRLHRSPDVLMPAR